MIKTSPRYLAVSSFLILFFIQLPVLSVNSKSRYKLLWVPYDQSLNRNRDTGMDKLSPTEDTLYHQLNLKTVGLRKEVFELALKGYKKLAALHKINREGILSIADFSKPSTKKRLFIIDINEKRLLLQTLVAHGRNSGMIYANSFSNKPSSNKSSLGFYTTLNTYWGEKGYALKLRGEEPGINDNAYDRNIVVHGSDYVTEKFMRSSGHLGRSLGCPAIPAKYTKRVIDYIKNGSCLFIYHPNKKYLKQTKLINS